VAINPSSITRLANAVYFTIGAREIWTAIEDE
jgi:hypothetical protein